MKKPLEKGKGKGAKSTKSKGHKWKGKGSFFEMSDAEKWWLEKFWSGRMRHLKDQPASKCRRIEAKSFTIRGWGEWPVLQSTTTGMSGVQYVIGRPTLGLPRSHDEKHKNINIHVGSRLQPTFIGLAYSSNSIAVVLKPYRNSIEILS